MRSSTKATRKANITLTVSSLIPPIKLLTARAISFILYRPINTRSRSHTQHHHARWRFTNAQAQSFSHEANNNRAILPRIARLEFSRITQPSLAKMRRAAIIFSPLLRGRRRRRPGSLPRVRKTPGRCGRTRREIIGTSSLPISGNLVCARPATYRARTREFGRHTHTLCSSEERQIERSSEHAVRALLYILYIIRIPAHNAREGSVKYEIMEIASLGARARSRAAAAAD